MPGKVKVKIIAGRNLPVMDRSSDTTDAYVEIKLGSITYKTDVCRKSLHPQWNSEWYRFEVDDAELQDEPLQIRLMDHDTYSANDAIGKVYLDLNPLLLPVSLLSYNSDYPGNHEPKPNSVMSGWIPVYDTMHGIRGEVNITVKVELFTDSNKFRQSSCGVQFFCSPAIPQGYFAQIIHGFVEELLVNDDPEYQWIDKIRTPRASNEARQTLFFKLSGELQRKIGVKALDIGGNAVIGYNQSFDLEGDSGIVARGIGTAVTLVKILDIPGPNTGDKHHNEENLGSPQSNYNKQEHRHQRTESVGAKVLQSPAKLHAIPCIHRRSSDSDLSITPKAFLSNFSFMGGKGFFRKRNSLTGSDRSCGPGMHFMRNSNLLKTTLAQENFDIVEYPFLTMSKFPPGFVSYLGGAVSARSVKLLERISNLEEPETRDIWWSEIRMEIRSHARSLNCNAVLGYNETTSICDDVCVLSANGTAAVIGYQYNQISECLSVLPVIPKSYGVSGRDGMSSSLDRSDFDKDKQTDNTTASNRTLPQSPEKEINMHQPCMICHLPYSGTSIALRTASAKCRICRYGRVPDVLITTIEMPEGTPCIGRGCFLQSYVCRPLKDLKGESNAKEISDGLPFLEYEIHRILVNKLKVKGMNAIFGLKIRLSIGDKMIIGIATGTAVFLLALPTPPLPKLVSDRTTDEKKLAELQKELHETIKKNKEIYQTKLYDNDTSDRILSDTDESEDEQTMFDLSAGNKDCCILEIDDPEDVEVINLLMEPRPPDGFHIVNTEFVPGLEDLEIVKNLQMFIQIWRTKIQPPYSLDKIFNRLLQTIYFKLRRMIPCALCDMQFRVDTPEPDEIQLCVLGMALGLGDPPINLKTKRKPGFCKRNDEDLIFKMEEINLIPENSVAPTVNSLTTQLSIKHRQKSPQLKNTTPQTHTPYRERHGVDITPLSYVPGGKIERYLGNLNFFFIRETTSIREEGGLSGFIHSFVTEVLAIVRAHVTALGGNAMVAYFMTECVLNHNPHKNQGQCLINIGGDVVSVSYFSEEE